MHLILERLISKISRPASEKKEEDPIDNLLPTSKTLGELYARDRKLANGLKKVKEEKELLGSIKKNTQGIVEGSQENQKLRKANKDIINGLSKKDT